MHVIRNTEEIRKFIGEKKTAVALGALFLNRIPVFAVKAIFIAVMLAAGIRMVL